MADGCPSSAVAIPLGPRRAGKGTAGGAVVARTMSSVASLR